jgi:hypothetical protein
LNRPIRPRHARLDFLPGRRLSCDPDRLGDPLLAILTVEPPDPLHCFAGDAIDAWEATLAELDAASPSWSFVTSGPELRSHPTKVAGPPGYWSASCWILVRSHLVDPTSVEERAVAFRELCGLLAACEVEARALDILDWPLLPHKIAWDAAYKETLHAANWSQHSFEELGLEVAMSGFWPALRAARLPLLAPWLGGTQPVRNREMFTLLHAGLSDELAYLTLSVAGGRHLIFRSADAALPGLAAAAAAHKLVSIRDSGLQMDARRSWRLAHEIWDHEALSLL